MATRFGQNCSCIDHLQTLTNQAFEAESCIMMIRPSVFVAIALVCVIAASGVAAYKTSSGLQIETRNTDKPLGECAYPSDTLRVHYTGRLEGPEGMIFDSSRTQGRSPFVFTMGKGSVIPVRDKQNILLNPIDFIRLGCTFTQASSVVVPPN